MMSEEQTHKSKKSVDAWIKLNKSVSRVLETVLFRNLGKWVRFGDVRLSISGFDGFRVSKDVHRRVFSRSEPFFAENLLLRSTVAAVEICDCYHVGGRWHPDRWARNSTVAEDANRRFQKIQEAYSVLSDEGKRSIYDAGVLDMFDEDEQESLEDLQRSFMETFGADLASYYESEETTAKKRERDGASNAKATKRNRSSRC
ncbi:chaperone DnaJ-domain superfamily protein [Actinidia rufa]|uniref:Chaperone DnaJ-domain superfamily protein n=1 Tax=Actinidia rufa TaxID=165716 RepID=A0A7J0G915_9ERIC|nr:chaperone DnaJ-domain superfamily protein [Actinidia rufa]